MDKQTVLIIFSKVPIAGQVKTRLIQDFGKSYSATIYRRLLWNTLAKAQHVNASQIQLYIDGNDQHPELCRVTQQFDVEIFQQQGKDLGERMFNALANALSFFQHAILIGCDCVALKTEDIDESFMALQKNFDIVLGPTEDGGYYLIGMNQPQSHLFENIDWGSETVLSSTLHSLKQKKLNHKLLNQYKDVDYAEDVKSEFFNITKQHV